MGDELELGVNAVGRGSTNGLTKPWAGVILHYNTRSHWQNWNTGWVSGTTVNRFTDSFETASWP
jgi:hypothetical protein